MPSEKKIQFNMCFYMQMSFDVNRLQNILKCLLHQSNNLKEQVTLIWKYANDFLTQYGWVCFFIRFVEMCLSNGCSAVNGCRQNPALRLIFLQKNNFLLDLFNLLSSPDVNWWTVDYCDVFIRLSFWRHPFTSIAETHFYKPDEETNSSTSWTTWGKRQLVTY